MYFVYVLKKYFGKAINPGNYSTDDTKTSILHWTWFSIFNSTFEILDGAQIWHPKVFCFAILAYWALFSILLTGRYGSAGVNTLNTRSLFHSTSDYNTQNSTMIQYSAVQYFQIGHSSVFCFAILSDRAVLVTQRRINTPHPFYPPHTPTGQSDGQRCWKFWLENYHKKFTSLLGSFFQVIAKWPEMAFDKNGQFLLNPGDTVKRAHALFRRRHKSGGKSTFQI